ncbi:MAG: LPS export ABC transporter periplasmic protein LptC [Lactobacillaceae bacterium]|nr:LPS export ABC transporter periplasmic protein LptC [Lactobacillaceae bacterium]
MLEKNRLDTYFEDTTSPKNKKLSDVAKHTKFVRLSKLFLPIIAAAIVGMLLIIPALKEAADEIDLNFAKPKYGDFEKLHVENTTFYITDEDNKVSNFYTIGIDETFPGSKLIKLTNPQGTVNTKNDKWVSLKSTVGFYNQNTNFLDLKENTEVVFSDGMEVKTEKVAFDFSKSFGHTDTPVIGHGVFGDINSESMEFDAKTKVIIFKGKTSIKINENSFKGNKK